MPTLLSDLTTIRLGGPARRVVTADSSQALVEAVRSADRSGEPVLLIGGGSNLVVGDSGWPGVVVRIGTRGLRWNDEVEVVAEAGVNWDYLVCATLAAGLSGLETMSGIPGLVGATPVQNVGAYGYEVSDVLAALTVYDRRNDSTRVWRPDECGFGFRTSAFKHTDRYLILDATIRLTARAESGPVRYLELARRLGVEQNGRAALPDVRAAVLDLRRSKGMVLDEFDHDTWSVGSFFVNPVVDVVPEPASGCPRWETAGRIKLSAAWLIEQAGFGKGFGLDRGRGRASVSTKHSLALTNRGGATTVELLALASVIRAGVEARFGVRLAPEAHLSNCEF
jgi:UDP-N-acetylmuramate dehydrogenase